MEHSKLMAESAPKSGSESHAMSAANKCSRVISKSYSSAKHEGRSSKCSQHKHIIIPTIRVVYVYEPKIIKTDPENFRSLVQRLTGKSSPKSKEKLKRRTIPKSSSSDLIASEVGTKKDLQYTFNSNDHLSIIENITTTFSSEDCSAFSKELSDADTIFSNLMNQGLLYEFPLVRNNSPFL